MGQWQNASTTKDIITEGELIELVGISKSTLGNLRLSGKLPFTSLSRTCRLYFVADVLDLLKANRKQINSAL